VLTEASFEGLTSYQASALVQEARKAKEGRRPARQRGAQARRVAGDSAERARVAGRGGTGPTRSCGQRAAEAHNESEKRREQEAAEAERREEAAKRKQQREAERLRDSATAREAAHRAEGQKAARVVGGDVGAALRNKESTYQNRVQGRPPAPRRPAAADIDSNTSTRWPPGSTGCSTTSTTSWR